MAVEIKEIVIKALVEKAGADEGTDNDEIVKQCVNQVLKVIKKSYQR